MEDSLKQVQGNKAVKRTYKIGGAGKYSELNWVPATEGSSSQAKDYQGGGGKPVTSELSTRKYVRVKKEPRVVVCIS